MPESHHVPVLLHETLNALSLQPGETAIDGTFGGGGHAREMCAALGPSGRLFAFDRDSAAFERTEAAALGPCHFTKIIGSFGDMRTVLAEYDVAQVDAFCLDLGISSDQLTPAEGVVGRGFSFKRDEPLLMTYESDATFTAADIVNSWPAERIAQTLIEYGDERRARAIAAAIVAARSHGRIVSSRQLADIVAGAAAKGSGIHPATKTFQALRITVNNELGELKRGLAGAAELAAPGARIAIITFHSLEDRIVKHTFRSWVDEGRGMLVMRKSIQPGESEITANPRSRSARLRAFRFD